MMGLECFEPGEGFALGPVWASRQGEFVARDQRDPNDLGAQGPAIAGPTTLLLEVMPVVAGERRVRGSFLQSGARVVVREATLLQCSIVRTMVVARASDADVAEQPVTFVVDGFQVYETCPP
jgi:hypothetical protein